MLRIIGILLVLAALGFLTFFAFRYFSIKQNVSAPASQTTIPLKPSVKVICKGFTNMSDALSNSDIACALNLSKTASLDLSQISKLTKLDDLNLSNDNLTQISDQILELKSLIILNLSNNKISQIPDGIANLKNLQILNLSGNPLSPSEQTKVKNLLPGTKITF